jgi:signal transduction histidine kinase
MGGNLLDFATPEYRHTLENVMRVGCNGGGRTELLLQRPDGRKIPILLTISPLPQETGASLCVAIVTDLSHQKAYEELQQTERTLRETDRRKDDFLAMLSHELRNPLAPIRNAVQILKSAALPPHEQQHVTEMMDRQVDHLVRLVDDLLEVSRIGRGIIELRKEWADLGAIVRSAVEASQPMIHAAGHTLRVNMPVEPVFLVADSVRLSQVIGNLLNNAAKFTDVGGRIWLDVSREETEVLITVRDTGRGISPEMLPEIFGMFVQVEDAQPVRRSGLGIGLTLVRRLVEMHGGRIEARSPGPGRGSEFTVHLPIGKLDAEGVAQPKPKQVRFMPGDSPRPFRVLVVDDHEDATASLGILLRLMGHDVRVANDGASAIEAACAFRPEVVLLDIGMPVMDGYEVARRLRREPSCDGTRLIALTGYGRDEDRQRSRDAGFDDHLVKPVDLESLRRLLNGTRT